MNRNLVGIIISVIGIILFIVAGLIFLPHSDYSHSLVSSEKFEELKSTRSEAETSLATNIEFNNYRIYQSNNTWYYSIVENNPHAYNPTIHINDSLKIAFNSDSILGPDDIAAGKSIDFIVYNSKEYSSYQLATTTLPIISIHHDNTIQKNTDTNFSFELFDNTANAIKRIVRSNGKIHIRGGITSNTTKQSYRINLRSDSIGEHSRKNNLALLSMREDDDWILYSPYSESTKIRNVLNSELWRQTSRSRNNAMPLGIENRYVEVIDNGNYIGLYALSTTIDDKLVGTRNTPNRQSFIFKNQNWEWHIDDEDLWQSYELKTDRNINEQSAWDTLSEYVKKCTTDFDYKYIIEHTNIDSLIDFMLFTNFTNNIDTIQGSGTKNLYLLFEKTADDYIVSYIPWDFDLTWGEALWDGDIRNKNLYSIDYNTIPDGTGSLLDKIAKKDTTIETKLKKRYAELRASAWSSDNIEKLIQQSQESVHDSGAYKREQARWPDTLYDDEDLTNLREYIKQHTSYLDYLYGITNIEPSYPTPFIQDSEDAQDQIDLTD